MAKRPRYIYARLDDPKPAQVQAHLDQYADAGWLLASSSSTTLNSGTDDEYVCLSLFWTRPHTSSPSFVGVEVPLG